jgi:hypothetical protein
MPKPLQPTSRDGRKSKRSPKEDSAGTRNRKQEITGSQKEKICTCAKKLLDDAVCGGIVLSDVEVVQKVLQKYADDWGFSDGHFDVLTTEDLCNLSLQVMSLKGPTIGLGSPRSTIDANSPSAHTSIQHGQTTPTQSPAGSPTRSECDQRSQGRVSEEVLDGSIHETESTITAVKGVRSALGSSFCDHLLIRS